MADDPWDVVGEEPDSGAAPAAASQASAPGGDPWAVVGQEPDSGNTVAPVTVVGKRTPQAPTQPRSFMQDLAGAGASLLRGTQIGDEVAAGLSAVPEAAYNFFTKGPTDPRSSLGGAFNANLAVQRQQEADFAAAHPHLHALMTGTGMTVPALATSGEGLLAPLLGTAEKAVAPAVAPAIATGLKALPGAIARGATTAAGSAALTAAADAGTPAERLQRASQAATDPVNALIGAATGGISVPGVGKDIKQTTEQVALSLKNRAQQAYQALDASGAAFRPDSLHQLGTDILDAVTPAKRPGGVHPTLSPNAYTALTDQVLPYLQSGQSMGMTALDEVRQAVRNSTMAGNPNDRRLGRIMTQKIDQFVQNANPSTFAVPVDPNVPWTPGASLRAAQNAQQQLNDARSLWQKSAQVAEINKRVQSGVERAAVTDSGANEANQIRQKLFPLNDPMQPKRNLQGLNTEQQAQLQSMLQPGAGETVLRKIGKLDPLRGGLMSYGGIGALGAALATHPVTALPVLAGGAGAFAARKIGDQIVHNQVDKLVGMIAQSAPGAPLAGRQLRSMMASNPEVAQYVQSLRQGAATMGGYAEGNRLNYQNQNQQQP